MGLLDTLSPWGAVASGIGALAGLGKTVIGGIQTAKANKQFNRLLATRPMYEIPKEYSDVLATYNRLSQGNAPGYERAMSNIGQATAQATESAKEGAISSNAYQNAVQDILDRSLKAQQEQEIVNEQYKSAQTDKAQQAKGVLGGLKTEQWNVNQYAPWQTEMNRVTEQRQTGAENLYGGLGDITGVLSNFAGTNAYLEMFKNLYPQAGGNGVTQTMSKPLTTPQLPAFDWMKYKGTLNG